MSFFRSQISKAKFIERILQKILRVALDLVLIIFVLLTKEKFLLNLFQTVTTTSCFGISSYLYKNTLLLQQPSESELWL